VKKLKPSAGLGQGLVVEGRNLVKSVIEVLIEVCVV
jgi:hypothetical protein